MKMNQNLRQDYLLLFYLLIIISLLIYNEAKGDTIGEVTRVVKVLQPKHDVLTATHIATELLVLSPKINIDWKIWLAMLYQESKLLSDPHNCLTTNLKCSNDYGLGQIHMPTWEVILNLDRDMLLTDERYGIQASYTVLKLYKKRYAKTEVDWYTRYHSSTPFYRFTYKKAVENWKLLIERILHGGGTQKKIHEHRVELP